MYFLYVWGRVHMHLSTPLRGTGCNFVYAYLNARFFDLTEIDQNYTAAIHYFDLIMLINWTKAQFSG